MAAQSAHILHLEARLLELADASKRVVVANGTDRHPPCCRCPNAEAEVFAEMLAIFPAASLATEKPGSPASVGVVTSSRAPTRGEGIPPRGFLVLANAKARIEESLFAEFWSAPCSVACVWPPHRAKRRHEMADDYLFQVALDCSNGAAWTQRQRADRGKDSAGVTLKEHQTPQQMQLWHVKPSENSTIRFRSCAEATACPCARRQKHRLVNAVSKNTNSLLDSCEQRC